MAKTTEKKEHLPLVGVGPVYVIGIILLTLAGIILKITQVLKTGTFDVLRIPFLIVGILLMVYGVFLWVMANFHSHIDKEIKNNILVTTGVYGMVRNPVYSGFMFVCTGVLFIANNLWLLLLPPVFWLYMTLLMKATEEKWLWDLYGKEYEMYCRMVNRCIPWLKRKQKGN